LIKLFRELLGLPFTIAGVLIMGFGLVIIVGGKTTGELLHEFANTVDRVMS